MMNCLTFTVQDSITSYHHQPSIDEELGRYNERLNYQHSSALQLYKEESGPKFLDHSMTLSSHVPVNHPSVDQAVHTTDQGTTKVTIERDQRPNQGDQRPNQGDQRPNQGDQKVTAVDQVTANSDDSIKKPEREPSVTSKDASSPAFLFITWNDVYAYMRSDGVKVVIATVCSV